MAAVVWRVLRIANNSKTFKRRIEQSVAVVLLSIYTELPILSKNLLLSKFVYRRMNWYYAVLSCLSLDPALKVSLFQVSRQLKYFADFSSQNNT